MTKHIGILLFDQVEELDAVGPWEVFAFWTQEFPQDAYAVRTVSRDGGAVTCAKGLTVLAQHSYADAPPCEVFPHPAVTAGGG